jgi:hypothetical protein
MGILKRDAAGNTIVSNFDGSISVENNQGKRVNKKDSEKFLKQHGFKTSKSKKKLRVKSTGIKW